jgi:DNA-3-methyladenine glycosylase II
MAVPWSNDPIMQGLADRLPQPEPSPRRDLYVYLLGAIVSQQLSTRVADVIYKRFLDLFPDRYPAAQPLLDMPAQTLRAAGLSGQKTAYLKNIAAFHLATPIDAAHLDALPDEEVIRHLTQIKGVGRWTVEMLLMFPMNRPDVFPIDDLGIRQSIISLYGLTQTGKALQTRLVEVAENWRPHRTLACKYLWLARDGVK